MEDCRLQKKPVHTKNQSNIRDPQPGDKILECSYVIVLLPSPEHKNNQAIRKAKLEKKTT
jgi:hypothetical protein